MPTLSSSIPQNSNTHSSHMSGLVHQSYKFYSKPIKEIEESKRTKNKGNFAVISSNSSSLSSLGSATNSGGFLYAGSGSCFLSFEDSEDQHYSGNMSPDDQLMNLGSGSFDSLRLLENMSCVQSGSMINENQHHGELQSFAWPNDSSSDTNYLATQESYLHKRTHSGESEQAFKKHCTTNTATKKSKQKSVDQPKDPQSIAAKNRRERISERLKVLQDLVPNGSKVDLVTMLEKAISYVKFLQLQVKVLATDEFWPVQDGKPPELSQVKEVIDAILSSSQRDRCSSSKTSS